MNLEYKVDLVLYFIKGEESPSSNIGYKVYAKGSIILFNINWIELERSSYFTGADKYYTKPIIESPYTYKKFLKCIHFCFWIIEHDGYEDEGYNFLQDKMYPLIERTDKGISLLDESGKKVFIEYSNQFYHYFTEV